MRKQHLLRGQDELVRDPGGPDALSRGGCGGCGGDCCCLRVDYCCGGFRAEVYSEEEGGGGGSFLKVRWMDEGGEIGLGGEV